MALYLVKPGVLDNLLFICLYAHYPDSTLVYLTNTGTCPLASLSTTILHVSLREHIPMSREVNGTRSEIYAITF